MNQFRGDITPAFASGNRGMQPLTDEQERLQRLLEAIILKTPGGVAKSIGEGIQTGVDVVGSIGQLDKAEQLGRQARRTLPDIVSAVTEQPGAVASALVQGLEQDVLDKGLGAFVGVEDAVPVVGKAGKFMGGIGAAAMMSKMPKMPKQAQDIVDASKRADVRESIAEKTFSEIAKDSRDFDHFFYRTGGGKYDFGVAERLQNEAEGETGLVLGDFIIGKKVRELYSDALNTPIIILNTPVHKGKKVDLGDVDFFGASGSYKGQPAIFLSNDADIKKNKIVGTILEEGAHTLRKLKGRQVQGAEQALKGDFDAYAASPEEVSAKKMVEFAAQLEEDKDGLLEFFNKATGSTSKMSKQAQDIVDASTKAKAGDLLSDPGEATAYAKILENEPGARISQRFPMGATATEDPLTENLIIDTDVMRSDPKLTGKLVQTISEYPNIPEQVVKRGDADEIIEAMKDHEISNLRFIFDQMPPEVRDRAMQWYDGANKVANEFGQRYGLSTEQSAGIMAALSPQMDWFKNVTLAERVMDTMKNHQSAANTKEMMEWLDSNFYKEPATKRSADWRQAIDNIRGKRLEEIVDPVEKALWLRAFDETTRDRGYRILTPEGDFGDVVKKADGNNARAGWGSFADIAKAVKVFDDGSMENISRTMGMQHKVRNFYNNIVDPDAIYGDVTMDTHAVAAGLLRPLSGSSPEVSHNLGQNVSASKPIGVQGTYPMHAEAYRDLATQEGMLPRQIQSVTWEGVRGMYSPEQKRDKKFQASVNEVFQNFRKGNMTLEDLQKEVLRISGGVDLPDWVNQ